MNRELAGSLPTLQESRVDCGAMVHLEKAQIKRFYPISLDTIRKGNVIFPAQDTPCMPGQTSSFRLFG